KQQQTTTTTQPNETQRNSHTKHNTHTHTNTHTTHNHKNTHTHTHTHTYTHTTHTTNVANLKLSHQTQQMWHISNMPNIVYCILYSILANIVAWCTMTMTEGDYEYNN